MNVNRRFINVIKNHIGREPIILKEMRNQMNGFMDIRDEHEGLLYAILSFSGIGEKERDFIINKLDDLGDKERQKLKSNFLKINFHMDDSYFYKPKKDKMMGGVHPEDLKVDYTDVFQLVSQMKEHWDSFYDKKPDTIQIRKIDCFQYYLYLWFKVIDTYHDFEKGNRNKKTTSSSIFVSEILREVSHTYGIQDLDKDGNFQDDIIHSIFHDVSRSWESNIFKNQSTKNIINWFSRLKYEKYSFENNFIISIQFLCFYILLFDYSFSKMKTHTGKVHFSLSDEDLMNFVLTKEICEQLGIKRVSFQELYPALGKTLKSIDEYIRIIMNDTNKIVKMKELSKKCDKMTIQSYLYYQKIKSILYQLLREDDNHLKEVLKRTFVLDDVKEWYDMFCYLNSYGIENRYFERINMGFPNVNMIIYNFSNKPEGVSNRLYRFKYDLQTLLGIQQIIHSCGGENEVKMMIDIFESKNMLSQLFFPFSLFSAGFIAVIETFSQPNSETIVDLLEIFKKPNMRLVEEYWNYMKPRIDNLNDEMKSVCYKIAQLSGLKIEWKGNFYTGRIGLLDFRNERKKEEEMDLQTYYLDSGENVIHSDFVENNNNKDIEKFNDWFNYLRDIRQTYNKTLERLSEITNMRSPDKIFWKHNLIQMIADENLWDGDFQQSKDSMERSVNWGQVQYCVRNRVFFTTFDNLSMFYAYFRGCGIFTIKDSLFIGYRNNSRRKEYVDNALNLIGDLLK